MIAADPIAGWVAALASDVPCVGDRPMRPVDPGRQAGLYLEDPGRDRFLRTALLGPRAIVFDGWLYDRAELAGSLGVDPELGDAALALHAYLRWGAAFVTRLCGAFALCLWDPVTGTALAARDPLGTFPLLYAHVPGAWFLAPSAESLRRHPAVPADLSRGALAAHLLDWNRDIHETVYAHIRRLPPGHTLEVGLASGTGRAARYWFPLPDGPVDWAGADELELFPALMKRAIARTVGRGRPGIYLSGGLDSGSLAMFATEHLAEQGREPINAFSLVPDDPEANEERFQRGLAEALGIPQTFLRVGSDEDLIETFFASLELNRSWPHPLASTFRSVYFPLGELAAAAGIEVILNGDGGDEWLAIHHDAAADFIARGELGRLRALTRTVRSTHAYNALGAARHVLWRHGLKLVLSDALSEPLATVAPSLLARRRRRLAAARIPSWLAPDPELRSELIERTERAHERASATHYARGVVDDTLEHPLTVIYMEESYEEARRIGVPIVKPYYDPDVVRFLARVPPDLRSLGGRPKGILVNALHERLPHLGYDRQEKPFGTGFFSRIVLEGLRRSWQPDDGVHALSDMGIVDSAIVRSSISKVLASGLLSNPKSLWTVLCAEHWARAR